MIKKYSSFPRRRKSRLGPGSSLGQLSPIKLVIVDFYGVMTTGSYKDTCQWIAKKYNLDYKKIYDVVYHKYFSRAAMGKITEAQSFALSAKELGLTETWLELRERHLSFQKLNKSVFGICKKLQRQGIKILLLSKNTPGQFRENLARFKIRKHFKNIINTYDLRLPKSSIKTIRYVLNRFRVRPQEVIMIDDQTFNLVEPKKLGVKTILYKHFETLRNKLLYLI